MQKIYVGISLVVVAVIALGGWWYYSQSGEQGLSGVNTAKEVRESPTKETKPVDIKTPSTSRTVSDTAMGVRFSIPKDWTASKLPESGYPSFVSPGYSYAAMKLKGAFVGYRAWTPDADYTGTTEELITSWKSTHRDVSEITISGTTAYSSSYGNRTTIFARINGRFVDIEYGDETGDYKPVFDEFLKSFVVE